MGRLVEWIIEHPEECAVVSSHDHRLTENDSETESMSDAIEALSLNETSITNERKYATRDDFESLDQYATYVRGMVAPGMIVRCCEDFEEIRKGDIGTIEKVEPEALHDLNVYVDWKMYGTVYWMRFVHIEILEPSAITSNDQVSHSGSASVEPTTIMVGSHVRIRQNVSTPRYAWGSVVYGSIGVVTAVSENGNVSVDFPQQFNWNGHISEMELVCQGNPDANDFYQNGNYEAQSEGDLIEDWSRVIRSLCVSSNESSAKYLLDRSANYWQSCSTQSTSSGKHWIRIEMHENVLIHSLAITVNGSDCSHMPSLIVVRTGDSVESLRDYSWVSIKPSDTNVQLLSDIRQYYKWIEIVVKQCRNNGIQCKVKLKKKMLFALF